MDTLIKVILISFLPNWIKNIYVIFCGLLLTFIILFCWRAGYTSQFFDDELVPMFYGIFHLIGNIFTLVIFALTGHCSNQNGCF